MQRKVESLLSYSSWFVQAKERERESFWIVFLICTQKEEEWSKKVVSFSSKCHRGFFVTFLDASSQLLLKRSNFIQSCLSFLFQFSFFFIFLLPIYSSFRQDPDYRWFCLKGFSERNKAFRFGLNFTSYRYRILFVHVYHFYSSLVFSYFSSYLLQFQTKIPTTYGSVWKVFPKETKHSGSV